MILKFIRSKDYSPKCEYFNVPDNSIIHRTRSHDDGLEDQAHQRQATAATHGR